MSAAGRSLQPTDALLLSSGWQVCSTRAGEVADPAALRSVARDWLDTVVPTTVAGAMRAAGRWSLDGQTVAFDDSDWWFLTRFDSPWNEQFPARAVSARLAFDGLATLCDVWLNDLALLTSDNMFVAYETEAATLRDRDNVLVLRFRSVTLALAAKRPRPRWRVPMIEQQQLRWMRTTLLGRTPGWSPPAAAVGPWRPIWLLRCGAIRIANLRLDASLSGERGIVDAHFRIDGLHAPGAVQVRVGSDGGRSMTTVQPDANGVFRARLEVEAAERWWPHTHGSPRLYEVTVTIPGGTPLLVGRVGFRTIELDAERNDFAVRVNGERIFCRGACWTPVDPVTLRSSGKSMEQTLRQAHDAGMNMLRIGGTMVYEDDAFYDLCDEIGILVWQEFMFANMDYPHDDEDFRRAVELEARQQLSRLHSHPCLALLCGNSEQEQQAAMWGAPRESWVSPLFHETLRAISAEICPRTPYWPSSAHGGAFPHDATQGTTSYYGVGAYLRPLEDARRAAPRFATECLAFANVPEPATIEAMPGGASVRRHHAAWAARAPRDLGAGWDFDDVRDHYLESLFEVRPEKLRYSDHSGYLARGRATSAEVMRRVFSEWRRHSSQTHGALVWFMRDLWPGAGWGVIGSDGRPKAAWHAMRETLQPLAILITDEGTNGLDLHVINERPLAFDGAVEIAVYRDGALRIGHGRRSIEVPGRGTMLIPAMSLFDGFIDLNHSYRFGPPSHDVVVATLLRDGDSVSRSIYTLPGARTRLYDDIGLTASASSGDGGCLLVDVSTQRFAYCVSFDAAGFDPDEQYFSLAPGEARQVLLRPSPDSRSRGLQGHVSAQNSVKSAMFRLAR